MDTARGANVGRLMVAFATRWLRETGVQSTHFSLGVMESSHNNLVENDSHESWMFFTGRNFADYRNSAACPHHWKNIVRPPEQY